jgi:enamine deaminase RidA (YjgF/YER057c/UK114 family)
LGAPNEAKFGFVQACRFENEIYVAGQVGKDNRSGEMLPARTFADHVRNALDNVDEACALVLEAGETARVVDMTVHVPGLGRIGTGDVRTAITARQPVAATTVGVPALASGEYRVEISAQAHASTEEVPVAVEAVPYPESISQWFPGDAAVRVDGRIMAAGHVSLDADGAFAGGSVGSQISGALRALDDTLRALGSSLEAVTSEHIYVIGDDQLDFEAVCAAHRSGVGANRPAATLILVDSLPVPGALVMVTALAV